MSRSHKCIYGKKCWCGAAQATKTLHGRSIVAGVGGKAGWPRESDAMGVNPNQVDEAHQQSVLLGVPTDFEKNGSAIIRDKSHHDKLSKALGLVDRSPVISRRPKWMK